MADSDAPEQQDDKTSILYGSDAWAEYLQHKPFPVRASSLKRLRSLLLSDSSTISDLTHVVKHDPILSFHVVREAEKAHAAKGSRVSSIDHAVSSLGMDPLLAISRKLQPVKINPASVQQKQYLRSLANSYHAAFQVRSWLQRKKLPFVEESFLAALFYGVAHWSLWLHAPLHMNKIQIKVREEQIDQSLAEHDVLGCTIQHISMALSQVWGLSELTIEAQDPETSPSRAMLARLHQRALGDPRLDDEQLREMNHLVQERYFPIKLGNWLAQIVSHNWRSSRHINTPDIIADYLGLELDQTMALLHQGCAAASRHYHVPGTLSPAADMLFIPSDFPRNFQLSERELKQISGKYPQPVKPAPKKKAVPPPAPTEVQTHLPDELANAEIFNQTAERFVKGYHLYTKPAHILQGLMQGLIQGLGLPRVVLNIANTKQHSLKAAQAFGLEKTHPLASYEIDLNIPSVFKKLTEKPGLIWIQAENFAKYKPMIPDAFADQIPESGCLLMSVFRTSGVVAVVYADAGETLQLSSFHQERFKYLCSAATLALKRMSQ